MTDQARAVFADRTVVPRIAENGVERARLLDARDSAGRSGAEEIDATPGSVVTIGDTGSLRYAFVVGGDWTVTLGNNTRTCGPDAMVQAPVGVRCTATVAGTGPGRLLVVTMPATT